MKQVDEFHVVLSESGKLRNRVETRVYFGMEDLCVVKPTSVGKVRRD